MAGAERKGQTDTRRAHREEEAADRGRGAVGAADGASERDDPREEEGWTQPESSAQKGALPDDG